jgi:hypothetical protein
MGAPNLAIVFAPNLIDMSATVDRMQVARLSETAEDFLLALLNNWDVSERAGLMHIFCAFLDAFKFIVKSYTMARILQK